MAVLSDVLERNSMEHCCIDFNFLENDLNRYCINNIDAEESFLRKCVDTVLEQEPDIVAISTWGVTLPFTVLFSDALKAARPALPLVLGGLKTEIEAIEILRYSNSFHTMVIGEGEELFPIILQNIEAPPRRNTVAGWSQEEVGRRYHYSHRNAFEPEKVGDFEL
jgi:radical SAM superfamily enzyme YgiQ (UPF0313 family)